MNKVAVVVLAGTESHADLGRIVNALGTAKEFKEAGDEVQVIFDGAGTEWVAELSNPEHTHSMLPRRTHSPVPANTAPMHLGYGKKSRPRVYRLSMTTRGTRVCGALSTMATTYSRSKTRLSTVSEVTPSPRNIQTRGDGVCRRKERLPWILRHSSHSFEPSVRRVKTRSTAMYVINHLAIGRS